MGMPPAGCDQLQAVACVPAVQYQERVKHPLNSTTHHDPAIVHATSAARLTIAQCILLTGIPNSTQPPVIDLAPLCTHVRVEVDSSSNTMWLRGMPSWEARCA